MITAISGKLLRLSDTEAFLEVGAFEYEVYVPTFVQRRLRDQLGQVVHLRTIDYLEGNPQKGRMTPRLIGFLTEAEKDFFETICSVDGVGVKKALKAIVRPVSDVARAIEDQNVDELSTLPGIGSAVGERIVAKLRKKMARFALMVTPDVPDGDERANVVEDTLQALIGLGHSPSEARQRVERALEGKRKYKTVEEMIRAIFEQEL